MPRYGGGEGGVPSIVEACEDLDAIISSDIPGRGVIRTLYGAARAMVEEPLTYVAALALHRAVEPGDVVLIATGAQFPQWPLTETDGPVGAAVLARALRIGLGAVPYVLTEDFNIPIMRAALRGLNQNVVSLADAMGTESSSVVDSFPIDGEQASRTAVELLDVVTPSAVISVEKPAWNQKQVHHSGRGIDLSSAHGKLDHLFDQAHKRGILTVGIGDGGNEIGMGAIADTIREEVPFGLRCQCSCGAGMASQTATDVLVAATVSNWGAYGVAAALAAILARLEVMHDEFAESEVISVDRPTWSGGWRIGLSRPFRRWHG